jgi:hypothetical protein
MGDTATADEELTEFELIEVESIKGVPQGANGFPHLIMKGVAAEDAAAARSAGPAALDLAVKAVTRGKIDEAPDIDLGQQIMVLLGKAIANEADEIAAGSYGETCDVGLLNDAASMINCWISRESAPAQQGAWDGVVMASTALADAVKAAMSPPSIEGAWIYGVPLGDDVLKAPREFSEADRKKHAAAGNALPDGSYPVPDKDALRRAAILARSGHGNVAAAKKLIARRAKELGVANPLDDDGKSDDAGKSAVAEGETSVQTDQDGTIAKAVEDAVAKAAAASEDRFKSVEERAAKAEQRVDQLTELIKSTPKPGGPVLSSNARPMGSASADSEDLAAKAALYRAKADAAVSPGDREGYRLLARETDEKAAKLTA